VQTLSSLTENYEQTGKENFLGNTGVQVFMATADAETPEYISKAIGDFTYTARSKSWQNHELMKSNIQESEQGSRLIRPEQIRLLDDDMEIVLVKGQPPLLINKVKYYQDKILKKIFDDQSGPLPEPDAIINKPRALAPARHEDGDEEDGTGLAAGEEQDPSARDEALALARQQAAKKSRRAPATKPRAGVPAATALVPDLADGELDDWNDSENDDDDDLDIDALLEQSDEPEDDVCEEGESDVELLAGSEVGAESVSDAPEGGPLTDDDAASKALSAQAALLEKIKRLQSGMNKKQND
jgi:Type IV secretory system Conjugative DNA transfer